MRPGSEDTSLRDVEMLADLARAALGLSDIERVNGWNGVQARTERRTAPRTRRLAWAFGTVALCGAGALAAVLFWPPHDPALGLKVSGGMLAENGHVAAAPGGEAALEFSDGTRVVLEQGTLARVGSVGPHGATIVVEHGHVRVGVEPRPAARWVLDAGPFRIEVKGTVFQVDWQPEPGRLRVDLARGVVRVSGPSLAEPIVLRGHQSISVDARAGEATIRDSGVQPVAPEAPPPVAPAPVEPTPAHVTRARAAAHPAWPALLAAGKLQQILAEADRIGLDTVLAHHGSADLAALADAARYGGRQDLARQALVAQRQRFAGSAHASEAAFLLGRIDEGSAGGDNEALRWYDRYLHEAPTGPYAAEVLGRKMAVIQRSQGNAKAEPVAEEYLRRYPAGSYAELARKLLRATRPWGPMLTPLHAALAVSVLAAAAAPDVRERPLVVMLLPPSPSRAVIEGAIRLNGELVGAGFDVQSTDRMLLEEPDRERLENAARELGASIVVALFDDPFGRSIDVWVVDRLTGKLVVRHVNTGTIGGDQAKLLAIRTAELLRASLLELLIVPARSQPAPPPAPTPTPPPPPVMSWVAADVDPGRLRRVRPALSVGGAALILPRIGVAPALDIAAGAVLDGRWSAQARLIGLGPSIGASTTQGAAELHQTIALLELGARLGEARLRPSLSLGAGVYRFSVDGRGSWPYQAMQPATTVFCVSAGAGAALRLPWRLALEIQARAVLAHPYPKVTIGGEEAGTAGRPTIVTSLVLTGVP